MARKKQPESIGMVELDAAMDSIMGQTAIEHGSRTIEADFSNHTLVIPVPNLCLEYLLGINGFPLSRSTVLAAENHVGKTAMLAEMNNWHRAMAGRGVVGCTEGDKDSPVLRQSISRYDAKALTYQNKASVEAWQSYLWFNAKKVIQHFEKNPQHTVPILTGVDSLVGVLCKNKIDDIMKSGHARADFATEAKLIGDWIKTYSSTLLAGQPLSFVGTSHIYLENNRMPNLPPKIVVSGGKKLLYMSAITILMRYVKKLDSTTRKGHVVNFSLIKNTLSGTRHFANFDASLYWEHDQENNRQRTWWDWDGATVELLADRNLFPATKNETGKRLVAVCNIQSLAGGLYYCPQLGVKEGQAMPASDLGALLAKNEEVKQAVREALHIHCHPQFQSFVKYTPADVSGIQKLGPEEIGNEKE